MVLPICAQLRISLARSGPISLERVELLSVSAAQPCVVTLRILPPGLTQARPSHDHRSLRAAWPSVRPRNPPRDMHARAERFRVLSHGWAQRNEISAAGFVERTMRNYASYAPTKGPSAAPSPQVKVPA